MSGGSNEPFIRSVSLRRNLTVPRVTSSTYRHRACDGADVAVQFRGGHRDRDR